MERSKKIRKRGQSRIRRRVKISIGKKEMNKKKKKRNTK